MKVGDKVKMVAMTERGDVVNDAVITKEDDTRFFAEGVSGGGKMWFDKDTLTTPLHQYMCTTKLIDIQLTTELK